MKRNFIYNLLLTVSNLLFPLLTFPYLSRILGADGLGIYNFIFSYSQNFIIISSLGIPVYGIREIAKLGDDKPKRSKLFWELICIHLLFTIFLLILYFTSVFVYEDLSNYKEIALLGGALIFFNVFNIEWLFSGVSDFKYITIRSLVIRGIAIIAVFLFVTEKEDYTIYFLITVVTVSLTVFINLAYARKFISFKIIPSFKGVLSHVKSVSFLGIYSILISTYSVLPTTLLGFLSTKSAVGYYFGAHKIIRMIISVFSALVTVLIPRLNLAVEKKDKEEYLLLVDKSLNIVISFGIPVTFLVFLLADELVMLLAGKDFINSVFVIKLMAPVILLVAFAQVFILLVLSANRKDKQMVLISVIGMIVSLTINFAFIPHFAERATGFAQLLSEFFVTFASFFFAKKLLNFQFPYNKCLINIICVVPFVFFYYISTIFFDNSLLIILFSGSSCLLYFIWYQLFVIKDVLFKELATPYLLLIRNKWISVFPNI